MVSSSFVVLFVVALAVNSAVAAPEDKIEEAKAKLVPVLTECGKENGGITLDFIKEFRASKKQADDNIACFLSCVYKKVGLLNEKGEFNPTVAAEKANKYTSDDDKEKVEKAIKHCEKVNKEAVKDGEKGCDRAKLLHNCFLEQKQQLNLAF